MFFDGDIDGAFLLSVRIMNLNIVARTFEGSGAAACFPVCWQAWVDMQPIPICLYAENLFMQDKEVRMHSCSQPGQLLEQGDAR